MTDTVSDEKLRAEWFWTDRWMGSSGFLLPLEPRGLYREMLTQAWARGAKLPDDHEAIRRATGCSEKEWRRCWPLVERYWRSDGQGNLVNDTQLEVYAAALRAAAAASEKARRAATVRWHGPGGGGAPEPKQSPSDARGPAQADARAYAQASPGQCPPSPNTVERETPQPPGAAPAGPEPKAALEVARCPDCGVADTLLRERPTEKRPAGAWWCGPKMGGCGAHFEIGDPDVLQQLPERIRGAIEARVEREEAKAPAPRGRGLRIVRTAAQLPPDLEAHREMAARLLAAARPAGAEWAQVLSRLRAALAPESFATWIRPLRALGLVDRPDGARRALLVEVPTDQFRSWLVTALRDQVREALDGLDVTYLLSEELPEGRRADGLDEALRAAPVAERSGSPR